MKRAQLGAVAVVIGALMMAACGSSAWRHGERSAEG